jgi:hypothetical protein
MNIEQEKKKMALILYKHLRSRSVIAPLFLALAFVIISWYIPAVNSIFYSVTVMTLLWFPTIVMTPIYLASLDTAFANHSNAILFIYKHNTALPSSIWNRFGKNYFKRILIGSVILAISAPYLMARDWFEFSRRSVFMDIFSVLFHWFLFHSMIFISKQFSKFHNIYLRSKNA